MTSSLMAADDSVAQHLAAPIELFRVTPQRRHLVGLPSKSDEFEYDTEASELTEARHVAERNPESATAVARFAAALLAYGDDVNARISALRAGELNEDSGDVPTALLVSQLLFEVGDIENSKQFLRAVWDVPTAADLRARFHLLDGEFDEAAAILRSSNDVPALLLKGAAEIEGRRFNTAIHYYRRLLRENPRLPEAYINVGYAYAALGLSKKAIGATRQALQIVPDSLTAHFNLVAFHRLRGDNDAALDHLRDMATRWPHEPKVAMATADVLQDTGQRDKAIRALRSFASGSAFERLNVTDAASIRANMVFLRWRARRFSRDEAIEKLEKEVIRTDYGNLDIARMLLQTLTSRSVDVDKAERLLSGLKRRHGDERLHEFEARVYFQKYELASCLEATRKWINAEPFSASAYTSATYLLCEWLQDHESAVMLGFDGIRRLGSVEPMLINNVAFSLAFLHRLADATELIGTITTDDAPIASIASIATRGLIALVRGDHELAEALYSQAADRAVSEGDRRLSEFVRLRYQIALAQLDLPFSERVLVECELPLSPNERIMSELAEMYGITVKFTTPTPD
jgi:tetratricopeptide (TPR) repeat protein